MSATSGYEIRRMKPTELPSALAWANAEGWNPGLHDASCFYHADANGFFVGLLAGQPIAVGSAVCYGDAFAFSGLYIVKAEFRRQGYGMQLTQARLNYLGARITGLDGVLEQVDNYAKLGYVKAHLTRRYQGIVSSSIPMGGAAVCALSSFSLAQIAAYEQDCFPAQRLSFLKAWCSQPESVALGYCHEQQLKGYAVLRRCHVGYKIGPLFADTPEVAEQLLGSLLAKIPGEQVSMDVPEPNVEASALARRLGLQPVFDTMRMYRNGFPSIDLRRVYGATTLELG